MGFQCYWSGIRLITFLGYKIIRRIDLDQFDEQVQVAIFGLAVGLQTGMFERIHLLQLARFVIVVITLCEKNSADAEKRSFHTACRLLVEYLGILVRHLNTSLAGSELGATTTAEVSDGCQTINRSKLEDERFTHAHNAAYALDGKLANLFRVRGVDTSSCGQRLIPRQPVARDEQSGQLNLSAQKKRHIRKSISVKRCVFTRSYSSERRLIDGISGYVLPEIANSFGIAPIYAECPTAYTIEGADSQV